MGGPAPGYVRLMTRAAGTIAMTLLLAGAPALGAGRPPAGATFAGKTSQGKAIHLRVVAGGGLQMDFPSIWGCSHGPGKVTHSIYRNERPALRPDGSYDYRKTYRHLPPVHGFRERQTERQHLTGRVGAHSASGT